jgi:hypothetical protein
MSDRNFKDFAVAYSIFKMMDSSAPIKTNVFAKSLNVGFHVAKRVISKMSKGNIVKTQRGFTSKGVERIEGVSVKEVFDLYNIDFKSDEDIANDIKNALSTSTYRARTCDICSDEINFRSELNICKVCQDATEDPTPVRLAKCGHPSMDRYFKCRACLPILAEETWEDELYTSHA